jgi:hypothetical protein
MPVGIIVSNTTAAAECAAVGAGLPDLNQAGTSALQNGCAAYPSQAYPSQNVNSAVVRQLPNVSRVQLPLTNGVTQCAPNQTNQFQVTLSLSGARGLPTSITLSPVPANCQNEETAFVAPATSATFLFSSRQSFVCTLSTAPLEFAASSVLTARGTGETEVVIVSGRAVNSVFPSATPSPTAGGARATLRVIVLE